jgi:N-acetylmuramic acid 6-phosphate etherase
LSGHYAFEGVGNQWLALEGGTSRLLDVDFPLTLGERSRHTGLPVPEHFLRSGDGGAASSWIEKSSGSLIMAGMAGRTLPIVTSARLSPTELRNPRSMKFDEMPLGKAIGLMLSEEGRVPKAVMKQGRQIEAGIRAIVAAFRSGGRLFYVGAGTSGRLGVLDASECPPTFRTPPEMVQAIIAGGEVALRKAVEGSEDDRRGGAKAMKTRRVTCRDVVVGIAASGTTPFVWGALGEAKRRGATTVLVCFNPFLKIPAVLRPKIVVAPNLGPELLSGSTRLKAGTATKMILNMFTTLAMVQLGKVKSNLMIDLKPANAKLRDRAVRILQELTGAERETAKKALERNGWEIKKAADGLSR